MALKYLISWLAAFLTLASCATTPPSDQQLADAETRIKVLEAEIKRTEETHRKVEREIDIAQRNLERQRANESRLRQDFKQRNKELSLQIGQMEKIHEQSVADAETRIKVLEAEIKRTEEAHRKAEREIDIAQRNLERQHANELRLRQDFEQANSMIKNLEVQVEEKSTQIEELAKQNFEKKDRGLTLDEQLTFLKEAAWSGTTWGVRRGTSKNLEMLPTQMNIDDSFTFRLVVQPERNSVTLTDIKNKFKDEYKVDDNQLEKIATTGVMAAELHGDGFTITPRKHPTDSQDNDGFVMKPIALYKETIWDWTVKAAELSRTEEGHALSLSLFAHPEDAKGDFIRVLDLDWQIVVYETARHKLAAFTGDHWQWIWTAFIVPVVGWIFQIRKSRKGYASA